MKRRETIEKRIDSHNASIERFRLDSGLSKEEKKSAIFVLQELVRQLKWILK